MQKIPTIFNRDWDGNRGVINELVAEATHLPDNEAFVATEKMDGTNVRLTVRNHQLVHLQKRRNPSKLEKAKGISDPWYVDTYEQDPQDKWVWDAARNTDLSSVPDGEWSGEAIGKNIQGNPLKLPGNTVVLFSYGPWLEKLRLKDVPTDFEGLKNWLPTAKSVVAAEAGQEAFIEGVVWHGQGDWAGELLKIKTKDFK